MVDWPETQLGEEFKPYKVEGVEYTGWMYSMVTTGGDTPARLKSYIGRVARDPPWLQQDEGISTELYMVANSSNYLFHNHFGLQY